MTKARRIWIGTAALALCALVGATVAFAAASAGTATPAATTAPHSPETPLTGETLSKASAAAIAKVGGTVDSATTENDGGNAAAAYEVHVTKTDGSHVTVILDAGYSVVTVESGHGHGRGPGDGLGHHGHGGSGETPLTGDVATKAEAAAVAKVGGTATFATTENDSGNATAAYEVHVTKADGSHVTVVLDKDDNVLTVDTHAANAPGSYSH